MLRYAEMYLAQILYVNSFNDSPSLTRVNHRRYDPYHIKLWMVTLGYMINHIRSLLWKNKKLKFCIYKGRINLYKSFWNLHGRLFLWIVQQNLIFWFKITEKNIRNLIPIFLILPMSNHFGKRRQIWIMLLFGMN